MIAYLLSLFTTVMSMDVNWSQYTDPIYHMFMGDPSQNITGIFEGDSQLFALFVFFILFLLTLMWGLGMLIGMTVIIPSLFLVFQWIPQLRVMIAIFAGLGFGLALHRLMRR